MLKLPPLLTYTDVRVGRGKGEGGGGGFVVVVVDGGGGGGGGWRSRNEIPGGPWPNKFL